jgi:hypothetical protein
MDKTEAFMVFGYWAIFTGVICVVGFTYMMVAGFSDKLPEGAESSSEENDNA